MIIYIAFIMLGLPNVLGSAWPSMHEQLGVSGASAGIISMILSGATILAALWCDKVIRRLNAGRLVLINLIAVATSLVGFSMSTHFISLCLWSIPLGLGMGFIDATLNNVVALWYEAKHMNWLHAFWGVGASIGPIIMSSFLLRKNSWEAGYRFIGLAQFVFIAVFLLTFKLWKQVQSLSVEPKEIQKKSSSMKQLIQLPGVKQSLLLFFCYSAIEATVGLWASSYLVIVRRLVEETATLWVSFYFGGITAGRFMAGFLTMKLSHKQLIQLGSGLIGLGIIILFLPLPEILLLIALFLIGLGCAPIFPSLIHETPNNFGAEHSQAIVGIQMAFAYTGAMLMPPLFGLLAELAGYDLLPFYIGGFLILMMIMAKWLYQKVQHNGAL
jgi:fucose permease